MILICKFYLQSGFGSTVFRCGIFRVNCKIFQHNITDDVNYKFSQSLNLFLSLSETGNSIHLRLYRPQGTHSHHDTRASRSILCINFSNFLINISLI